jgi:hypothetical protein
MATVKGDSMSGSEQMPRGDAAAGKVYSKEEQDAAVSAERPGPATDYVVLRQHVVTIAGEADGVPPREAVVWEELGIVTAGRRSQAWEKAQAQHPEITPATAGITEKVHLVNRRSWREIVASGEQDEVRVTVVGI